jgi:hypothetical protein
LFEEQGRFLPITGCLAPPTLTIEVCGIVSDGKMAADLGEWRIQAGFLSLKWDFPIL